MVMVLSRTQLGMQSFEVQVTVERRRREVFAPFISGLPQHAAQECTDRIRRTFSALNKALPLDELQVRLSSTAPLIDGTRFDLPIFVGLSIALEQLLERVAQNREFYGMLDGLLLKSVDGLVPSLMAAAKLQRRCVVPEKNLNDGAFLPARLVNGANDVVEVIAHLTSGMSLREFAGPMTPERIEPPDFSGIPGMARAKRALMLAAAGGLNILLCGPDMQLRTRLAESLRGLLPPLTSGQQPIVAQMLSLGGFTFAPQRCQQAPFRAPAPSVSEEQMFGSVRRPGEVSLATCGVLLIDDALSFQRRMLERVAMVLVMREIEIKSTFVSLPYPAQAQLVATVESCLCGQRGVTGGKCICHDAEVLTNWAGMPGEFISSFDLIVNLWGEEDQTSAVELTGAAAYETVLEVRRYAKDRLENPLPLAPDVEDYLNREYYSTKSGARAKQRIYRVAHTIASVAKSDQVKLEHAQEAIQFWHWPLHCRCLKNSN